jgi:hypothetical protein
VVERIFKHQRQENPLLHGQFLVAQQGQDYTWLPTQPRARYLESGGGGNVGHPETHETVDDGVKVWFLEIRLYLQGGEGVRVTSAKTSHTGKTLIVNSTHAGILCYLEG